MPADRFWSLYDTSFRIDAENALGWSADCVRERQRHGELEIVHTLLYGLAGQGHAMVTSRQVAHLLRREYGVETTPERVGKMMMSPGVRQKRAAAGRFYDLTG